MRWLAATLGLLAASAALVAGVYLRDRDPQWLPPQRTAAAYDAHTMLEQMHCGRRCSYTLVGNPRPNHWVARVDYGTAIACYDINLISFDTSTSHGVSGVATVHCGAAAGTAGG